MAYYCIDADPDECGDRRVHDLTPGRCDRLPPPLRQEHLGWHNNFYAAVAKAKMWYKTASACPQCSQLTYEVSSEGGNPMAEKKSVSGRETYVLDEEQIDELDAVSLTGVMRDITGTIEQLETEEREELVGEIDDETDWSKLLESGDE